MGSEDLFHERKARSNQESKRRKASRKPYDRVLIVCEGEKTEPFYFEEIKVLLEIDSANIEIDGTCGSSPISVVKHALSLFERDCASGDTYNKVYCVFDRDSHETYEQALEVVNQTNIRLIKAKKSTEVIFTAIRSIPSFEYWLLLHFITTTKPYERTERKSAGDQVIDDLKRYMPNYKKTKKGIFIKSKEDGTLEYAMAQSKRIFESAERSGNLNPSTNMHELIKYLKELKNNK